MPACVNSYTPCFISLAILVLHTHTHTHTQAVRLLEGAHLKDEKDEKEWKQVLLKLYLNQSLVSLKMNKYRLAIAQCRKALDIEPNNVKANFRLGRVNKHTHTNVNSGLCIQ